MRRSGRRLPAAVFGLVTLTAALAGAPAVAPAAVVQSCTTPRPLNEYPDSSRFRVVEGQPVPALLGMNCLPIGDTLSSPSIDWGDGAGGVSPVTYHPDADGVYEQAWFEMPHSFARATCPASSSACRAAYTITATAIDDATGAQIAVRSLVTVTPGPSAVSAVSIRARSWRRFRGAVARIHTAGVRFAHELSARIGWGDGTHSAAVITGHGHGFAVRAAHRWARRGRYAVTIAVRDSFAHARRSARGIARVR